MNRRQFLSNVTAGIATVLLSGRHTVIKQFEFVKIAINNTFGHNIPWSKELIDDAVIDLDAIKNKELMRFMFKEIDNKIVRNRS